MNNKHNEIPPPPPPPPPPRIQKMNYAPVLFAVFVCLIFFWQTHGTTRIMQHLVGPGFKTSHKAGNAQFSIQFNALNTSLLSF